MSRKSSRAGRTQQGEPLTRDAAAQPQPVGQFQSPCEPDPGPARNPYRRYTLDGPQCDPEAAFWTQGAKALPRTISIHSVLLLTTDPANSAFYIPPYPRNKDFLEWEIAELAHLQNLRDDPSAVEGSFAEPAPLNNLYDDYLDTLRLRISDFIQLDPPPFGAIYNAAAGPYHRVENISQQHLCLRATSADGVPALVTTGRNLARMFENETPGLIHRSALNYLLYRRPEISPPRQARVWMALDITIYSALVAAWHYKWGADPSNYSFRQRPAEYDQNASFQVLFDAVVNDAGDGDRCARSAPCPSPGTPRSPAYPSGHSAYASAGSEILAHFFPEEREQFELLADNIGVSQLWAGVNWRSDHAAGRRLGRAVASRVIEQLKADCVPAYDDALYSLPDSVPPDSSTLRLRSLARRNAVPCDDPERNDTLSSQRRDAFDDCAP